MKINRITMKRINRRSIERLRLDPPPTHSSNSINSIPHDLIIEILARVASSSASDLYNVKLTCKDLNKTGDDKYVYQHISMEDFEVVPWSRLKTVSSILKRCEENENPEALFRRGLVEYFSRQNPKQGRELLHRAANLGHTTSIYVLGIILLEDNDQSIRDQGMELLNKLTSDFKEKRSRIIRDCRQKSKKILHQIWINSLHSQERPKCGCNMRYQKRGGWSSSDEENEEVFDCETCKWNHEVTQFYKMLKGN